MAQDELDPQVLSNLQYILADVIAGDDDALARPEYRSVTTETLQKALGFLLNNELLDDKQKAFLIANSWRINYRDRPPTPEEFITEKYIGRAALHTYDRVKDTFVEFMNPARPYRNLILYPHIGWGKAQPLWSKVLTPEGWKTIGEIAVGDQVLTPFGKKAAVTALFPQGRRPYYKVTLKDGRAAECDENHLWRVFRGQYAGFEVLPLHEIASYIKKTGKSVRIQLLDEVAFEERSHIISPYILGALIGDGCITENSASASICGHIEDREILDRVVNELPAGNLAKEKIEDNLVDLRLSPAVARQFNPITEELKRLQLWGHKSYTKFLPREYLEDSRYNRIALLQGLLDTDGYVDADRGSVDFSTASSQLAEDFVSLVRSLGGLCYRSESMGSYRLKGQSEYKETCIQYSITINRLPVDIAPFFLKRKMERYSKKNLARYEKCHWQKISSIDYQGETETKCILLDSEDHLYITDNYIVTHNSYAATLANVYVGVHLSLMRNPYKYFGLNPASILSQLLVSYSLRKSSELLLEPLIAILEASPFFEKVHTREGMIKRDQEYERKSHIDKIYWTTAVPTSAVQFSNGANFKLVSNIQNLLGLSVVTGTMSELGFFRDAGKTDEYIMRMFNDLKNRIDSRMKGNYFGRSILDSSPNTLDSPIDDYVVNLARKDPTNFIIDGSVWKWAPEEFDMTRVFSVYTGGKGQPPRILDGEDISEINPTKIIEVPQQLKQFFTDDLYKALKDRAGIPAGSADNLIYY